MSALFPVGIKIMTVRPDSPRRLFLRRISATIEIAGNDPAIMSDRPLLHDCVASVQGYRYSSVCNWRPSPT